MSKDFTYELLDNGNAIRCLACRTTSYDPNDVLERKCLKCGTTHAEMRTRMEKAMRTSWKVEQASRTLRRAGR